jgi:hypothetical protein
MPIHLAERIARVSKLIGSRRWSIAQDASIDVPFHGLSIDTKETMEHFGSFQVDETLGAGGCAAAPAADDGRALLEQANDVAPKIRENERLLVGYVERHADNEKLLRTPEQAFDKIFGALDEIMSGGGGDGGAA